MTSRWHELVSALRGVRYQRGVIDASTPWHAVEFAAGLSAEEIVRVEERHGFRFPDDLRELLQTALPVGDGFPDWRDGDERALAEWLAAPKHGLLFDVEQNALWLTEWDRRPAALADALAIASAAIDAAPRLVPVFAHRMMSAEPLDAGNPVFSVHQSDVVVYGGDLEDWLRREFIDTTRAPAKPSRPIRFWSRLVDAT